MPKTCNLCSKREAVAEGLICAECMRNAALGESVRKMPDGWCLAHRLPDGPGVDAPEAWVVLDDSIFRGWRPATIDSGPAAYHEWRKIGGGDTPEAAIADALEFARDECEPPAEERDA